MSKLVTTPFAIFAAVKDGRCYYLQFMDGTVATSASFRSGGQWMFRSNPDGGESPSEALAARRRRPADRVAVAF